MEAGARQGGLRLLLSPGEIQARVTLEQPELKIQRERVLNKLSEL